MKDFQKRDAAAPHRELKAALALLPTEEVARALGRLGPFEKTVAFKLLPAERAFDVFARLSTEDQGRLFCSLELGALGPALEELGAEAARGLFHQLPEETVRRMSDLLQGKG